MYVFSLRKKSHMISDLSTPFILRPKEYFLCFMGKTGLSKLFFPQLLTSINIKTQSKKEIKKTKRKNYLLGYKFSENIGLKQRVYLFS